MEKKMYNVPSTAVTEVEALNVIMGVTQSFGDQEKPQEGGSGLLAPKRVPEF